MTRALQLPAAANGATGALARRTAARVGVVGGLIAAYRNINEIGAEIRNGNYLRAAGWLAASAGEVTGAAIMTRVPKVGALIIGGAMTLEEFLQYSADDPAKAKAAAATDLALQSKLPQDHGVLTVPAQMSDEVAEAIGSLPGYGSPTKDQPAKAIVRERLTTIQEAQPVLDEALHMAIHVAMTDPWIDRATGKVYQAEATDVVTKIRAYGLLLDADKRGALTEAVIEHAMSHFSLRSHLGESARRDRMGEG